MINKKLIAARIREARKSADITQEVLAEWLDVNTSHVCNLESGKKGVSLNMIAEISKVLQVSTDYLILGKESNEVNSDDALSTILKGCDDKEKQIIYECLSAIKIILINNR